MGRTPGGIYKGIRGGGIIMNTYSICKIKKGANPFKDRATVSHVQGLKKAREACKCKLSYSHNAGAFIGFTSEYEYIVKREGK